jgi:hypothetical protein
VKGVNHSVSRSLSLLKTRSAASVAVPGHQGNCSPEGAVGQSSPMASHPCHLIAVRAVVLRVDAGEDQKGSAACYAARRS